MAIRYQPQSEKHPFPSPTTPGLYVTFRAYIIELVCLNINPKLGPRFWSDPKYWGLKFRREVKGVANLSKELDLTNTLIQTALVQVIKEYNIKALVAKKTVARVVRLTNRRITDLKKQRQLLAGKQSQSTIDTKKNATFIDTGDKSTLNKIKELENN